MNSRDHKSTTGRPLKACQLFNTEPSDQELANLIDPFPGTGFSVRIIETPREIRAVVATIPLGCVVICELPVVAIFVWNAYQGGIEFAGLPSPLLLVFVFLAFTGSLLIVHLINRGVSSAGKLLILDKTAGTLELPRYGITLCRASIRRFVEVRGFKKVASEKSWIRELSVLAETDDRRIARFPVAFDEFMFSFPKRRQLGKELAEFFGVPLSELKS